MSNPSDRSPILILIADDHPLFRMGLRLALKARDFEVVAEVGSGAAAIEAAKSQRFDVAILDVRMPAIDGIEACRSIALLPEPPIVIMLSTFEEAAVVRAAADAGATAYLSKETDPDRLAMIIRDVIADPQRTWIPHVDLPRLTAREQEVLAHLAHGWSNKRIARELGISPETVKDHLTSLYDKLHVRDRLAALSRAREVGLLASH